MSVGPATAGEDWAAAALAQLRAGRWSPGAGRAFLAQSAARARDTRRRRPALARRARAWEAVGAGATAVAVARRVPASPRFALGAVVSWASVSAMLEWHLGMVESEDGEPRNLGVADALTLGRAWLVPLIADRPRPGLVLVAGATDALDGIVARRGTPTRAGRDLEGLVDAAVALAATGALARAGRIPRGCARLERGRIVAGSLYGAAVYLSRATPPGPAVLRAARATTPLRVAGLVLAGTGHDPHGRLLTAGSLASLVLLVGTAI